MLARNFRSKNEVKEMTDLSLGENSQVLAQQEEAKKMRYLQVVI